MVLYSQIPTRALRQGLGDLWLILWSVFAVWFALEVKERVEALAAPGRAIADAALGLTRNLETASTAAGFVPLVGDVLARPFEAMTNATQLLETAGRAQADAVMSVASLLQWTIIVLAIVPLASLWIPMRIAFIRRASAARRFVDSAADLDLFALRAMARQPLHVLAKIDADPVGAWRRGDQQVINQLARLELRAEGIGLPKHPAKPES
jgi:hypothetical protein